MINKIWNFPQKSLSSWHQATTPVQLVNKWSRSAKLMNNGRTNPTVCSQRCIYDLATCLLHHHKHISSYMSSLQLSLTSKIINIINIIIKIRLYDLVICQLYNLLKCQLYHLVICQLYNLLKCQLYDLARCQLFNLPKCQLYNLLKCQLYDLLRKG